MVGSTILYFILLVCNLDHAGAWCIPTVIFFSMLCKWVSVQQVCCHYVSSEPNQDNGGILVPKGTYTTQYVKNSYSGPWPF